MKTISVALAFGISLIGASTCLPAPPGSPDGPQGAAGQFSPMSIHGHSWKPVWSDEFKYQGLPDPAKWDYEEGFVRNHENQYYTRDRQQNARVEDGHLIIEGRKEHFAPAGRRPAEYTSASLTSKASWVYGRIEMRAKIPQGKGVWPAFWTLGANRTEVGWPRCGEIDIMEFVGKDPDHIHGTVHYGINGHHESDGGKLQTDRPYDGFHVYAVEWYPDRIDFYFDQQKYHSSPVAKATDGGENPFRKPHYILVNLALGGDWGGPIDDANLPQPYVIDYVRVYQLEH
jgi:beta-glucanase (GH16 family)